MHPSPVPAAYGEMLAKTVCVLCTGALRGEGGAHSPPVEHRKRDERTADAAGDDLATAAVEVETQPRRSRSRHRDPAADDVRSITCAVPSSRQCLNADALSPRSALGWLAWVHRKGPDVNDLWQNSCCSGLHTASWLFSKHVPQIFACVKSARLRRPNQRLQLAERSTSGTRTRRRKSPSPPRRSTGRSTDPKRADLRQLPAC